MQLFFDAIYLPGERNNEFLPGLIYKNMQNDIRLEIKRLTAMNLAIVARNTGCPIVFAENLGCSESTFYRTKRLLSILLADFGIEVKFDEERQTYYYSSPGSFTLQWNWDPELV